AHHVRADGIETDHMAFVLNLDLLPQPGSFVLAEHVDVNENGKRLVFTATQFEIFSRGWAGSPRTPRGRARPFRRRRPARPRGDSPRRRTRGHRDLRGCAWPRSSSARAAPMGARPISTRGG